MYLKEIIIGLVCFSSGYGIAFINADDGLTDPSQSLNEKSSSTANHHAPNTFSIAQDQQLNAMISNSDGRTLSSETIEKIKIVLDHLSPQEVEHYLSKAFSENDLSMINDKKKFSERLLQELSQDNQTNKEDLPGKIILSRNLSPDLQSDNLNQIHKNQQITAHYDTLGRVPQGDQVFVKWINKDSGEVLLFSPQSVNAQSNQNWVSYSPPNGWKSGAYTVEYYQMNDQLTPIAQTDYTIGQVVD